MPFLKKIKTYAGIIGVWQFSESASEMLSDYSMTENEKAAFRQFKIEKRRKEFLATRLLLKKLLEEKTEIKYSACGKPFLIDNNIKISISHSNDFAVIILSEQQAGIDAENIYRNTDAVANKFLSDKEQKDIDKMQTGKQLAKIVYWCAKEAVFKCTPLDEIDFKNHINIKPFEIKETGTFKATLQHPKLTSHFHPGYFFIQNNAVVFCVEDKKIKK